MNVKWLGNQFFFPAGNLSIQQSFANTAINHNGVVPDGAQGVMIQAQNGSIRYNPNGNVTAGSIGFVLPQNDTTILFAAGNFSLPTFIREDANGAMSGRFFRN